MCGIIGYVGPRKVTPLLVEALHRLEYRGYDSAGVTVMHDGVLMTHRVAGRVEDLQDRLRREDLQGTIGIGHTRWATHGEPNVDNAHPHIDCGGTIAIVHNGIIENAPELRDALTGRGHTFRSETDTEVLVHLIEQLYDGSLIDAVAAALHQVDGAYGIAVVSSMEPGTLVAARNGSPLLIGLGEGENFVASDASAILEHTRTVVYLDDGEIAQIRADSYQITDLDSVAVEKLATTLEWDLASIGRAGYPHFMLKEIMEQPESIRNTIRGRLLEDAGTARLNGLNLTDEELLKFDRIVLTACGTSWHAALIGEYMLEELARIPVEVEYASEFRYRNPVLDERTLVIGISQSGETADTRAALKEAKQRGARTLGIVNVVGSTIAREVDGGIYTHAGPEIGVASTKAFTSQVVTLAMFTLRLGRLRALSVLQGREIVQAIRRLPGQAALVLDTAGRVSHLAETFMRQNNAL